MKATRWHNCYDGSWRDLIVPDAFAHPAKFAPALVARIYAHGLKQGWWRKGDLIGDPFGGIAGGGIMAGYAGLNWIGVELEPRFAELGNKNLTMHGPKWMVLGEASCVKLVQGDSRRFAEVVGAAAGIVTSPPYAETGSGGNMHSGAVKTTAWSDGRPRKMGPSMMHDDGYGDTPGQIGALKAGELSGIVTSPPWESTVAGHDAEFEAKRASQPQSTRFNRTSHTLPEQYGRADGQIGNDAGETYWQAMSVVYRQCYLALKPGCYMAVVVKDYVQNKQRVPLCDQTLTLLMHVGFEPVERIHAMLVQETSHECMFSGATVTKKKERKSFFRRLAEKKGSPRIDWEEMLVVRRGAA